MILTDKTREQFESWYIKTIRKRSDIQDRYFDHTLLRTFYDAGSIMINSFMISFFDENRILIDIHPCLHVDEIGGDTVNEFHFFVTVADMDNVNADYPEEDEDHYFKERIEAQEFGIKWANRIYNEKHK